MWFRQEIFNSKSTYIFCWPKILGKLRLKYCIIADALFVGALELSLFASDRCSASVFVAAVPTVILSVAVVGNVDALLVVARELGPVVAGGVNLAAVFSLI